MSDKTNHFAYLDKVIDKYETDIRNGLDICIDKFLKANPEVYSITVHVYDDYNDNNYSSYKSVAVEMVEGYAKDPATLKKWGGNSNWDLGEHIQEDLYGDLPPSDLLVAIFGEGWIKTWINPYVVKPNDK